MSLKKTIWLYISYMGHGYRGLQSQSPDIPTVSGSIREALLACLGQESDKELKLRLSSRTDAGVHALVNIVSTPIPQQLSNINLRNLQTELNGVFSKNRDMIRKTLSKTYVYRLGLLPYEMAEVNMATCDMSIMTYKTIGYIRKPKQGFSFEKFARAGETLSGINDFSLFRVIPECVERRCFQRVVRSCSISIKPGLPPALSPFSNSHFDKCEHWNIVVSGQGFMHKQVRYMVGAMLSVGSGTLSLERLKEMLNYPEFGMSSEEIRIAQPYGLYLTNLEFPENH
ncbi:tRNA pseudouridine synthase A 2-like isoform X2 [Watersipora subatra]|uniref:tRNA pseudouridine synthase A 2-like isoform X2 n=1 Tax=Watersipora subatra TaxID=2589382 RepID=UPI00355C4B29